MLLRTTRRLSSQFSRTQALEGKLARREASAAIQGKEDAPKLSRADAIEGRLARRDDGHRCAGRGDRPGRVGQAGQLEESLESVGCFSPLLRKLCPLLRMRAGFDFAMTLRSVPTASKLPPALARPVFGPEQACRKDITQAFTSTQPPTRAHFHAA